MSTRHSLPLTYATAAALLGGRASKRLMATGSPTYAEKRGDAIAVRVYATDVLTFQPDGSVIVRTGGHRTNLTRNRVNAFLPPNAPRLCFMDRALTWHREGRDAVAFSEGDTILADGSLAR